VIFMIDRGTARHQLWPATVPRFVLDILVGVIIAAITLFAVSFGDPGGDGPGRPGRPVEVLDVVVVSAAIVLVVAPITPCDPLWPERGCAPWSRARAARIAS
jgi:hypothetical protein